MPAHARTSANDTLDRFIARVLGMQVAWVAAGEEGLGRVPSPTVSSRMVTLLWSKRSEAERWGAPVAARPRIKALSLRDLYVDVLPKLAALNRLVGPDWGSEPSQPEIGPDELASRLRCAAVALFLREVQRSGSVWVLQGAEGPACLVSKRQPGALMLPCWHRRDLAQARIAGPLADMVAAEVPLEDFREKTLLWIAESRRQVAPAFCEGDGVLEFEAADLEAHLAGSALGEATAA